MSNHQNEKPNSYIKTLGTIRCIFHAASDVMLEKPFFTHKDLFKGLKRCLKRGELEQIPSRETQQSYLEDEEIRKFMKTFYPGVLLELSLDEKGNAQESFLKQVKRLMKDAVDEKDWDPETAESLAELYSVVLLDQEDSLQDAKLGNQKAYTLIPDLPNGFWQYLVDAIRSYPGFSERTVTLLQPMLRKYWLKGQLVEGEPYQRTGSFLYESTDLDRLLRRLCKPVRPLMTITMERFTLNENGTPRRVIGEVHRRVYPCGTVCYQGIQYLQVLEQQKLEWQAVSLRMDLIHGVEEEPMDEAWAQVENELYQKADTSILELWADPSLVLGAKGHPVTLMLPMELLDAAVLELGQQREYRQEGDRLRVEKVPPALAERMSRLYPGKVEILVPQKPRQMKMN